MPTQGARRRKYRVGDVAEKLRHEQIDRPRRLAAREASGERRTSPLPRVYSEKEDEPIWTCINLPLDVIANVRPPEALAIEYRALKYLRERRSIESPAALAALL